MREGPSSGPGAAHNISINQSINRVIIPCSTVAVYDIVLPRQGHVDCVLDGTQDLHRHGPHIICYCWPWIHIPVLFYAVYRIGCTTPVTVKQTYYELRSELGNPLHCANNSPPRSGRREKLISGA